MTPFDIGNYLVTRNHRQEGQNTHHGHRRAVVVVGSAGHR